MPKQSGSTKFPRPFGPFVLTELLGVGGMARVFAAYRLGAHGVKTRVAVKSILPALADDPAILTMFVQEASVCAQLRHPNIVATHEFNHHDGLYYLQMEVIDGCDLKALFDAYTSPGQGLPLPLLLEILCQLTAGLAYVHGARGDDKQPLQLVHRDLKPSNVFINQQGIVKVGDFGLAKGQESAVRTATGRFKGTLVYMAPEQLSNAPITQAVDVFSFGLIAYRGITGERLLKSTSIAGIVREQDALDLDVVMEAIPPSHQALGPILRGCLQRDPSQRLENGGALHQALLPLRERYPLTTSLEGWMATRWEALNRFKAQPHHSLDGPTPPLSSPPITQGPETDWNTLPSVSLPVQAGPTALPSTSRSPHNAEAITPQRPTSPPPRSRRYTALITLPFLIGAALWAYLSGPSLLDGPGSLRSDELGLSLKQTPPPPVLPPSPTPPPPTPPPPTPPRSTKQPPAPAPIKPTTTVPSIKKPRPKPKALPVEVTLSTIPRDATLIVDGSPPRAVPWTGPLTPGAHSLEIQCPGVSSPSKISLQIKTGRDTLGVWDCNKAAWFRSP